MDFDKAWNKEKPSSMYASDLNSVQNATNNFH